MEVIVISCPPCCVAVDVNAPPAPDVVLAFSAAARDRRRLAIRHESGGRETAREVDTYGLVYRAQPLSEVVADLNRQFVEQTAIADPELARTPITGVIVLDNPRAVVSRLSLMLPIRALPSDKGLMLLRK